MIITQNYKDKYFENSIGTITNDLKFNYLSFISTNQSLDSLNNFSSIPAEIDRIFIDNTNMSSLNAKFTFNFTIASDKAVCATTEILAKDSTSTIIQLDSSIYFEVNNLIEVETSTGFIETSIFAKSGDNITIQAPINATIGGIVRKKISHIAVLCNATSTYNALDLIYAFFPTKFFKDSTAAQTKKLEYNFRGNQ